MTQKKNRTYLKKVLYKLSRDYIETHPDYKIDSRIGESLFYTLLSEGRTIQGTIKIIEKNFPVNVEWGFFPDWLNVLFQPYKDYIDSF